MRKRYVGPRKVRVERILSMSGPTGFTIPCRSMPRFMLKPVAQAPIEKALIVTSGAERIPCEEADVAVGDEAFALPADPVVRRPGRPARLVDGRPRKGHGTADAPVEERVAVDV
jgi:hypothetical protein